MSGEKEGGGYAYPRQDDIMYHGETGVTLRDYFAGQALANGEICTGLASDHYLKLWFGERFRATREDVAAKQSYNYADAMLETRK